MTDNKDIILLLDESGSMADMGDEPVQAVNTFIQDQQRICPESKLSILTFNTSVSTRVEKRKLSTLTKYDDFVPNGLTALYDAIGKAINDNRSVKDMTVVIITDGKDNASHVYTRDQVRKMTSDMEKNGWNFVYLGANQDAFAEGDNIGIHNCSGYDVNKKGDLLKLTRQVSHNVGEYRSGKSASVKAVSSM